MSRKSSASQKLIGSHHCWKSQTHSEINPFESDEKPMYYENYSKNYRISKDLEGKISKTVDNREVSFKDSPQSVSHPPSISKSPLFEISLKKIEEAPKKQVKSNTNSYTPKKPIKNHEEIIKLQEGLIEELKKEIKKMKSPRNSEAIASESPTKGENTKLVKRIEKINKEHDLELKNIKKGIERKDEIFNEFKIGMKMKLEKKKLKISLLKRKIESIKEDYLQFYDKACKNAFEDLKILLEKETKEKLKLEDELFQVKESEKTLKEENLILVQNYEEIKKRYQEMEGNLISLNQSIFNLPSVKNQKISTLDEFFKLVQENEEQYQSLSFKCKQLTEKNSELEASVKDFKQKMKKPNTIEESKLKLSNELEKLAKKLKKKSEKVKILKEKLSILENQLAKSPSRSKGNHIIEKTDISLLENQISILEDELTMLKSENIVLGNKEKELNQRLKNSEKARYYYQEQTIMLKEKVNSLEQSIKIIESSIKEAKNQENFHDSPHKLNRTKTAQELRLLLKESKRSQ